MEQAGTFEFDQLIIEKIADVENLIPVWLHISFRKNNNRKYSDTSRLKLCYMKNDKYYKLTPEQVLAKNPHVTPQV